MLRILRRLTRHQALALMAALLGAGALLIGNPEASARLSIDTRELAAIVESESDHVTPAQLADWILAGRQDYRLIDLRSDGEYAAYHIPNAERIPITDLLDGDLARNEKIVLLSAEGIHSAQAWMLLKANRYPAVYLLLGGSKQWQEQVLFPLQPAPGSPEAERKEFALAAERARFFGGSPRAASALGSETVALLPTASVSPSVAPPPAMASGAAKGKKKKEGC
jgi:rhodanese-related sulfurtransferase